MTDPNTLDTITFTDHERVDELQDYAPVLINNPQQIHGFTSEADMILRRLNIEKLALVVKMGRGRTSYRNYVDEQMMNYQAEGEVARSINGFERGEVTSSHRTTTNYNTPVKPSGVMDRFLGRLGRSRNKPQQ